MKYLSVSIVKVGSSVKFKSTSESAVHSHIYTHCLSCVSCIVYKVYAVPSSIQDFYF